MGREGESWLAQGSSFPQLGPHPRGPVRPAEVGVREGALTLAVPVTTTCCRGRRQQRDRGTGPGRTGLNRGLEGKTFRQEPRGASLLGPLGVRIGFPQTRLGAAPGTVRPWFR